MLIIDRAEIAPATHVLVPAEQAGDDLVLLIDHGCSLSTAGLAIVEVLGSLEGTPR